MYFMPSYNIFHQNQDITPVMRCKLINWLIEVSLHFRFHRETLYLAVHFMDRYLTQISGLPRTKYQLVGVAAMYIAAKLEVVENCSYLRSAYPF